ncbi:hypothetical protein [Thalassobacillus sp. CUG 92003]|uniref:hypothetical protein n=1 Tax=Thalassobacillus sp. CUG 92003 TaxID=2736641 RepID=UPI0015E63195|nr:hypothetical protein [Thalassobacillus sp. CUG 92003]
MINSDFGNYLEIKSSCIGGLSVAKVSLFILGKGSFKLDSFEDKMNGGLSFFRRKEVNEKSKAHE